MKRTFLLLLFCLSASLLFAQNFTVSGYIRDNKSGEELLGANVYVQNLKTGTITNVYGFYSLTIPKGEHELLFSYLGYTPRKLSFNLQENSKFNIELSPSDQTIEEIDITAERKDKNIMQVEMSTTKLQMKAIKKIPALMGEVDIIKSIQMLPGVQSGGEGTTGFYVRGGGADQNLILLDDATVYNASHLGGFFSVFNQDAVKDVKLYKGGIPAEYGGRLASLLDIRLKEGNMRHFAACGGIGLLSSRLTLEAPIIKDRWTAIVSGRRTYFDIFLPLSSNEAAKESKPYFYDLTAKTNFVINDKNRIYISGYFGKDVVDLNDLMYMGYGNQTLTLRYNHLVNERIFSNVTAIVSNFNYGMKILDGAFKFTWDSGIKTRTLKNDNTFFLNPQNKIAFGASASFHEFNPGEIASTDTASNITAMKMPIQQALEYGFYLQNEHNITSKLSMVYGLRLSIFQNYNKGKFYEYDRSNNDKYLPVDTFTIAKGQIFNTYYEWEPRMSLRYQLNESSSIKASYNRTTQFIQLATNTMSPTPFDVWFPSSRNVKPQRADQVAAGYFRNFRDNSVETSVEFYYKKMYNVIDFRDHANLMMNEQMEGEIRNGKGYSYGAEFMIRKEIGKLSGWISYTWSQTKFEITGINAGNQYSAAHDKPHNLVIVLAYDITPRINIAANWIYTSGAPRTMPTGRFDYQGMIAPVYSDRNGVRLHDYHRMDLSCNIQFGKLKTEGEPKKLKHSLNISIYNVYNRHNDYSINFRANPDNPMVMEAERLYLFAIFPSITYNFEF